MEEGTWLGLRLLRQLCQPPQKNKEGSKVLNKMNLGRDTVKICPRCGIRVKATSHWFGPCCGVPPHLLSVTKRHQSSSEYPHQSGLPSSASDSDSDSEVPQVGPWNIKDSEQKNVDGAAVNSWICINFTSHMTSGLNLRFCYYLGKMCNRLGMAFNPVPVIPVLNASSFGVDDAMNKLQSMELDLLIVIVPNYVEERGPLYGDLKRICKTLEIVYVCCFAKDVTKINRRYLESVAQNIINKVGRKNKAGRRLPLITHSHSAEDSHSHSITAVVDDAHVYSWDDSPPKYKVWDFDAEEEFDNFYETTPLPISQTTPMTYAMQQALKTMMGQMGSQNNQFSGAAFSPGSPFPFPMPPPPVPAMSRSPAASQPG